MTTNLDDVSPGTALRSRRTGNTWVLANRKPSHPYSDLWIEFTGGDHLFRTADDAEKAVLFSPLQEANVTGSALRKRIQLIEAELKERNRLLTLGRGEYARELASAVEKALVESGLVSKIRVDASDPDEPRVWFTRADTALPERGTPAALRFAADEVLASKVNWGGTVASSLRSLAYRREVGVKEDRAIELACKRLFSLDLNDLDTESRRALTALYHAGKDAGTEEVARA